MRVLVTGGTGFIGTHVASHLRAVGHNVTTFDLTGPKSGNLHIRGDLTDLDAVVAATKDVEGICHLGGVGDVYLALREPYTAAAANVTGTANVMEAALRNSVTRVVYASTWEVYGKPHYQPIDESHPTNPDHPYSITKLAGEQIALSYDRLKDVGAVALRLGTTYGPGMRSTAVIPSFISSALHGRPISVQGSGLQRRQFTHVQDVAAAFGLALESKVRAEVINIVAAESVCIHELAEMVTAVIPAEIQYSDVRLGDPHSAHVSAEKANLVLGWSAKVRLDEGLCALIRESQKEPA